MPAEFRIDRSQKMVFSTARGVVTDHEVLAHQDRLRNDPDFEPSLWQFIDFTHATRIDLSVKTIQLLAQRNPFGKHSRRAFYAPDDILYGLARMFQILTDHHKDELNVYRDISEARKFLNLEK